jgi:hypothetical protein
LPDADWRHFAVKFSIKKVKPSTPIVQMRLTLATPQKLRTPLLLPIRHLKCIVPKMKKAAWERFAHTPRRPELQPGLD